MLHRRMLSRAQRGAERYEVQYDHPDGSHRVLMISANPLTTEDGRIGSLAMVSDVTVERRAEEELRHQALHDPLTGLPNRALLTDRLEVAAARQNRDPSGSLAVLFLDLDHLKIVNDRGGHSAGDALLVEVGRRLETVLRQSDTVGRLGGDEFAVICEDTSTQGAMTVARRIQGMFVEPFDAGGHPIRVSASIGVAVSPPNPAGDLLRLADTAMYQAKARSRGSFVVFDSSFAEAEEKRRELTGDLRDALSTDRVFLHYQPVIDLVNGRLRGIEALVRWDHPTRGMLPALELIAAAQEAGLEIELDRRVLRAACQEMGRLVRAGVMGPDAYVSVNISARSASAERIDMLVPEILRTSGLQAQQLMLEVTETSILTDVEYTVRQLKALSEMGVRVAVDDFGTGYSSLAYLHRLPLGILKIDRSFVSGLPDDPDSSTIVRSVISLAESLGLHTIAEGIETPEQAQVLRELGCNSGQGFLWSRAVPPAALDAVSAALRALE
jgi:diguanylate cyclase (GGDEF)-like protein